MSMPVLGLLAYGLLGVSYWKHKLLTREIFTQSAEFNALIRNDKLTWEIDEAEILIDGEANLPFITDHYYLLFSKPIIT